MPKSKIGNELEYLLLLFILASNPMNESSIKIKPFNVMLSDALVIIS